MLSCPKFCGQKLGSSCCFQCAQRYSTGFSSGAYAGRNSSQRRPRCCAHKIPHRAAAMARQSVPDDQQLAGDMTQQMRKEQDDLRAADGSRKQSEVEVPPGHPGHRRQGLPVEVILQHRRLPFRRPGAAAVWALAQSAFVDENDRAPLVLGFFLISGQRFCFHCRIFSSFRSRARPAGRWQLHPNCRKMRQTWPG